jgi:hypothetical protein
MTLQFEEWPEGGERLMASLPQSWICPHCFKKNDGKFPVLLKWVTKRTTEVYFALTPWSEP